MNKIGDHDQLAITQSAKTKTAEFANSIDLLDLYCLSSSLFYSHNNACILDATFLVLF